MPHSTAPGVRGQQQSSAPASTWYAKSSFLRGHDWAHLAIALAALLFTVLFLATLETPVLPLLWYFTVFIFTTTVPGALLWRAITCGRSDKLTDLAMGTGFGILLQLVLWFVFVSLGIGGWLILGPLLVYVPFFAVPNLRKYWKSSPSAKSLPVWVTAAVAVLYSVMLIRFSVTFTAALPPSPNSWNYDQYWHLGNAAGLLTRNHLIDMRVVDDSLSYHWLYAAHSASQALTTGIELPLLYTRMWVVPLMAIIVALAVAVGKSVTRTWWPGVLFAAMVILTPNPNPTGVSIPFGGAFNVGSPSQSFALVIMLMILFILTRLWRSGRLTRGEWALFVITLLAAPGSKSTILPLLICGFALGLVVSLLRRRSWKLMGIPLGASLVVFLVLMPFLGDDGTGSRLKFLSMLRFADFYTEALGLDYRQVTFGGGILPMSMLTKVGLLAVAVVLLAYFLTFAWLFVGVRPLRRAVGHEGGWMLLGMGIAGMSATMIIDVSGRSQAYFLGMGVIGWYLLAAWGLHLLAERVRRRDAVALAGAIAGILVLSVIRASVPAVISADHPLRAVVIVGAISVFAILAALLVWVLAKTDTSRREMLLALSVALVAGALFFPLASLKASVPAEPTPFEVSTEELVAADWLRQHSNPDDVIATNAHCWPEQESDPCPSRSFWVSGFTQRPVFIEGWAYTNAAHAARGVNDLNNSLQPFHDTDRLELNDAAFIDPSAATMGALKAQNVTWLFAAKTRSEVAGDIGDYATEVFSNDDVAVYRLD
ncbi:hypothetical protein [Demequina aurantiaca]|uniref:hypothetical protein n=1 Tax=Demequina aurantiaca TaxID=676200 RepID=UPI0007831683|nr:hypothetical protein [Demequina aurantiaca]